MEKKPKYVLAMYDVRGKQDFIFRSNKIKEIVGGSLIIRDVFKDYLYDAAKKISLDQSEEMTNKGIFSYTECSKEDSDFSEELFKKHLEDGYIGEVIYDGGGNFFVLYKSAEILKAINKRFTKAILEKIGTLKVLCAYIEIDNFSNYRADEEKLRKVHRQRENEETIIRPVNAIPFIQMDSITSQPVVHTNITSIKGKNIPLKTTQENYAKYKKFYDEQKNSGNMYGEQILDNFVEEKGKDSKLAVIFIDGNNMGAKVSECLKDVDVDYKSSIKALRRFSSEINKKYVIEPKKAIEEKLNNRMVVFAGDEMSFVCKASDALKAVETYFSTIRKDKSCSSCAGIAIFHSHAPYSEAYKIAEECCENAKHYMRENKETDTCYIDFQFCQSGLGMELDTIRKIETGDLTSKPWLFCGNSHDKTYTYEEVKKVVLALNGINSRTNVKGLVFAAKESLEKFDMEMSRIYAHFSDKDNEDVKYVFDNDKFDHDRRRKLVYDIGIVYDTWFRQIYKAKDGLIDVRNGK